MYFNAHIHKQFSDQQVNSAMIGGIVGSIVFLIILVVGVVVWRKEKK